MSAAVGRYRTEEQVEFDGLERYAGLRVHGAAGVHAAILEALRAQISPPANVLDLACGEGALTRRLADAGYSLTACDLIGDKFKGGSDIRFRQANLNRDFSGGFEERYDAVIASEIIEHLENPRHFLRQIANLLRPDGTLVITTPNLDSPFSKAMFLRAGYHQGYSPFDYSESGHITPMSLTCLTRALNETGFQLRTVSSVGAVTGKGWWKMKALARLISPLCDPRLRQHSLIATARYRGIPDRS